jgi:hypothetical protein
MQSQNLFLLLLAGLCASVNAVAAGPTATAVFQIVDPVTDKRTTVLEARLDQHVCLSINAELVPVGEHSMQVTSYDGLGNEVHKFVRHKIVSDGSLSRVTCFAFEEDHHAAGTWWYVVELDDKPLVSTSIEIRPKRE